MTKKEYLLEALLNGSALILINQDGMLSSLTLNNLYSLISIEGDEVTFLMESVIIDGKGINRSSGKSIAWTFNTEDIYVLNTFDGDIENTIQTTFWMDKYPHKEDIKEDKFKLVVSDFKKTLPPVMTDKMAELLGVLNDPENDLEVFDCDTNEDALVFFVLENHLLDSKGYLTLCDTYIPIALG